MRTYLGVDGGGTKTAFLLTDEAGRILGACTEGPAYYLEVGFEQVRALLARGIQTACAQAAISPADITFSFLGLPAHGEDSRLLDTLDASASPTLQPGQYRCGNDAVCAWAGALACQDGINIVAGTGSIAYGEFAGRTARAGGWGELFSDEGSAHWLAREGLALFSRMSDGRIPRGPLHEILRRHFGLTVSDLDLCAAIYGEGPARRSGLAALAGLMAEAAQAGDPAAAALFARAAQELASMVEAVRRQLQVADSVRVKVSYTGGVFQQRDLLLRVLEALLTGAPRAYEVFAPRLSPVAGAALYASKLAGNTLPSLGELAAYRPT